jgi:methyl-accepting chemotaxis protein
MDDIVTPVQWVADRISGVAPTGQQQRAGIEQINQIDDVSKQNAALVEEAAATATILREQADYFY